MKKHIINVCVWFYKNIVKPIFIGLGLRSEQRVCIHTPSCSVYAKEVFLKEHFLKGLFLASKRLLSCHPWNKR